MRKLMIVTALLVGASISAIAEDRVALTLDQTAQVQLPVAELPQTPSAPAGWYLIASVNGPRIPVGWQLHGIEAVIYNGNTVNRWQIYLYNPTTRATVGWLIGVY
jgi:hypothetical protein